MVDAETGSEPSSDQDKSLIRKGKPRRTEGLRVHGRSARVVESVLRVTAQEISRVGYAALRIEDVAERSGVNKTTIYRRWPTRADLVEAALRHAKPPELPDTGTLREDLLRSVRDIVAFAQSSLGSGIMRMVQTERAHPEVDQLVRTMRGESIQRRIALIERGIERGELPKGTSARIVADAVFASVYSRIVASEVVGESELRTVVNLVLAGASAGAGIPLDVL
jgi:AcrR family transcriptional regulator